MRIVFPESGRGIDYFISKYNPWSPFLWRAVVFQHVAVVTSQHPVVVPVRATPGSGDDVLQYQERRKRHQSTVDAPHESITFSKDMASAQRLLSYSRMVWIQHDPPAQMS